MQNGHAPVLLHISVSESAILDGIQCIAYAEPISIGPAMNARGGTITPITILRTIADSKSTAVAWLIRRQTLNLAFGFVIRL